MMMRSSSYFALFIAFLWNNAVLGFAPASSSLSLSIAGRRGRQQVVLYQTTPLQQQEAEYMARPLVTPPPDIVYILLFNPGTPQEGVHTSSNGDDGVERLWAFESLDDCRRLADLIMQYPSDDFMAAEPIPTPAPLMQMQMACQEMGGLVLQVVPAAV